MSAIVACVFERIGPPSNSFVMEAVLTKRKLAQAVGLDFQNILTGPLAIKLA